MGDRVSIQFVSHGEKSPVLFSHWDGMDMVFDVKMYVDQLRKDMEVEGQTYPLYRLEAQTVMMDYIRHLLHGRTDTPITHNYYLACSADEGDNSDNGHWIIDLETGSVEKG